MEQWRGELQEAEFRVMDCFFIEAVKLASSHEEFKEFQGEVNEMLRVLEDMVENHLMDMWVRQHEGKPYYPGVTWETVDGEAEARREFEERLSRRLTEPDWLTGPPEKEEGSNK